MSVPCYLAWKRYRDVVHDLDMDFFFLLFLHLFPLLLLCHVMSRQLFMNFE